MTDPRLADYLSHMEQAAAEAIGFIDGMTREAFLADRRTQQAVVMSLVIIGEACTRIMDGHADFVGSHPEIPWRSMRGMRNRMAHGYFETDFGIVWDTVKAELPTLVSHLSAARAALGSNDK